MSIISKLFPVLIFSALVLSGFSGVSTYAENSTTYIVTAKGGINVRDKNCKKVEVLGFGSEVTQTSPMTINCNINGTTQTLVRANAYGTDAETYISTKFLSKVISGPDSLVSKTTFKVNNPGGLNLRTGLCKRVMTLPNNTTLAILPASDLSICKVGNTYYRMMPVLYNGQNYSVASVFLS